jgi:hypothetical protein
MFALEPVTVTDFSKAREFWMTVLAQIGYRPQHCFPKLQTFGKTAHCPNFSIVQGTSENFNQTVIYLQVDDAKEVHAIYSEAIAAGGKEAAVDERRQDATVRNSSHWARFLDIDGNTVEVYVEEP